MQVRVWTPNKADARQEGNEEEEKVSKPFLVEMGRPTGIAITIMTNGTHLGARELAVSGVTIESHVQPALGPYLSLC